MDPRTVAHVLNQIGDLLELHGENRFKTAAYRNAARAVLGIQTDDLRPLYRSGELRELKGIGPATLSVIRELVETGESSYFEQLREDTPEGLIEMLRVPGLGTSKIHAIHEGLGIDTLHELEEAARDGRLARLPRFGAKTAEKILRGIAYLRETSAFVLDPHALAEAQRLLAAVAQHPDVERAMIAGSVRRRREVIRDIDIVAACRGAPAAVASSFAHAPAVRDVIGAGGRSVQIRYVDGTRLDLHCVEPEQFGVALWRATGSEEHEREMRARAAARGLAIIEDELRATDDTPLRVPDEPTFYELLGLPYIEPELREGRGELDAAERRALPSLITARDIRGVLHCHSQYSDGKSTIAEMAQAAKARGWSYLGISDHSQSAFYAGGLASDAVLEQHDEIDCVNASVHSRFSMDEAAMTERVLRALDDPHVTILGHPTGRLLLTREPYAIDMGAVLEKAAEAGVAVELNADPHRLDLDWRLCQTAKERGCTIEIGPDAHSVNGLDNVEFGIGIARKGWLEPADVLNTASADDVITRARRRRVAGG